MRPLACRTQPRQRRVPRCLPRRESAADRLGSFARHERRSYCVLSYLLLLLFAILFQIAVESLIDRYSKRGDIVELERGFQPLAAEDKSGRAGLDAEFAVYPFTALVNEVGK